MSSDDNEVTITLEEYWHLLKREEMLCALEQGGVENWLFSSPKRNARTHPFSSMKEKKKK